MSGPVTSFAPGKLFIAGEYSVVTSGRSAVLVALSRGITAEVTLADSAPSSVREVRFVSSALPGGGIVLSADACRTSAPEPVERAVAVLAQYVALQNLVIPACTVNIASSLADPDGTKFGFGSSGAVVVAVIDSLAKLIGLSSSHDELFRLSALAVIASDHRASCADVATSVLGGWVEYSAFDRDAVLRTWRESGIETVMNDPWPGLRLKSLPAPSSVELVVGWSGKPASTKDLVSRMELAASDGHLDREAFERESEAGVGTLVAGIEMDDAEKIIAGISAMQKAIHVLDLSGGTEKGGIGILTPELNSMIRLAENCGAVAKSSGAGGGDCAISVASSSVAHRVRAAWESNGFVCPELSVCSAHGETKENA